MNSQQSQINKTFETGVFGHIIEKMLEFFSPSNNDSVLCDFEDMLAS